MKSVSRPSRRIVLTWLAATALAVLLSIVLGDRMRHAVFDGWQSSSPRDLSGSDVRVVMIDNASVEAVGPWPWPRYYLARLTEELAARDARVIAFDVLFAEPDRVSPEIFVSLYPELGPGAAGEVRALPPMDALFGRVIGSAPVVLAHAGVDEVPADQSPIADAPIDGELPTGMDSWPAEVAAIPVLDDVALGHGLANARPDRDGVIRTVPMVMLAGGKPKPGFALEVARHAIGGERITVTPTSVRLGNRRVPIDRNGRLALHFGQFPPQHVISAADILGRSKRLERQSFAGKTVIIGLSADGTSDIAAVPTRAEEFGPLVQAQAVDTLLRGGWLDRPNWAGLAEWAAAALLALLALGNALFHRSYRIGLGLLFAAVPLGSWLAFSSGVLLDPARPLLVGGGAVAGVMVGLFSLARSDRERLRDALVQERVTAAEAEGELQAARTIQLGMVPSRERLRALDPRIDLDALLEPARVIGGDFYDALKIGDDRIALAIADVTGKGIPAALYMAMSKTLTATSLAGTGGDPAAMASAINADLLADDSDTMGVTMLIAVLDLASGDVRMVCAGHEDPLVVRANGNVERVRLDGGPPFGVTNYPYPVEALTLRPGDTLVLVTDGVTEAQDGARSLFGIERLLASDAFKGSATEICEGIRDRVRSFEGGEEPTDDLTVMAVRYLGARSQTG